MMQRLFSRTCAIRRMRPRLESIRSDWQLPDTVWAGGLRRAQPLAITAERKDGHPVWLHTGDMGRFGELAREKALAFMADDMESLAGVTAASMVDEIHSHAQEFMLKNAAAGLVNTRLLALTSDDGGADDTDAFVAAIKAAGGKLVTTQHAATDHAWSDHRIALESTIIGWLADLNR